MKLLQVQYDLNQHETTRDYGLLIKEIYKLGKVAKGLKSSFFIKTNLTPDDVFDILFNFVDSNDGLEVIEIKSMQCNRNLPPNAIALIKETLYPTITPKLTKTVPVPNILDELLKPSKPTLQPRLQPLPKMNQPLNRLSRKY